jgi:hypothetical protein
MYGSADVQPTAVTILQAVIGWALLGQQLCCRTLIVMNANDRYRWCCYVRLQLHVQRMWWAPAGSYML